MNREPISGMSGPVNFLMRISSRDHLNFTEEEEDLIRDLPRYSLGPKVLHADHAIVLLWNEIDRRMT